MSTTPSQALPNDPRRTITWALVAAGALMLAHQAVHWNWYIDDSAISFAYARNWADGEGLVPLPGAERIEGYSNPTWVVLLALFELVGLSGFLVSKPLAAVLSLGTLGLVYRIACKALPERPIAALLAPFALALNAQFCLWAMSALENSLFCFLLALGVDLVIDDAERDGVPWSPLAFLALAWTRPEATMYAAIAGGWYLLMTLLRRGRMRWVAAWVAMFWVPFALIEAVRLWYFAWPLANTYYAKVGVQGSFPLDWEQRGWEQVRDFSQRLWHGWFLPIYFLALFGTRGRRAVVGVIATLALGALLFYPGPQRFVEAVGWWPRLPMTITFAVTRIWILAAVAVGFGFVSLGSRGGETRGLLWHLGCAALFFSVYANGDWMGGYRWMSLGSVSAAVLFAVGVAEVADRLSAWAGEASWESVGWTAASVGIALLLPPNFNQTRDHRLFNRNETPFIVKRRGDYTTSVLRRTFSDARVTNLEMDQGAHMWWYPHYREVDMAGLIDIPMSRHRYNQRPFIQEYVFEERPPTFAHVHGGWATNSGFKTYDDWFPNYVEMPPYDDADLPPHDGVWARRDLFVRDAYPTTIDRQVVFGGGVELVGLSVPMSRWSAKGQGFVELALRTLPRAPDEGFTVWVTLSNDAGWVHTHHLEPGVGLYPSHLWEADDIYVGRVAIALPDDAPTGSIDVGVAIVGPDGTVLPAGGWDGSAKVAATVVVGTTGSARVAVGEARFPGLAELVDVDPASLGREQVEAVRPLADAGDCEGAEAQWLRAKRVQPDAWDWHDEIEELVSPWIAGCWVERAVAEPDSAVAHLARAHDLDHRHPRLTEVGAPLGERLWNEGLAAREEGDVTAAYRAFTDVLSFQPWRSWARRYAEEARDERLGIRGLD